MQHNILAALCCIIPFLSCKKDENSSLSAGTYKSSGVITHHSLTLYTKDRAITDKVFISSFVQRHKLSSSFSLKDGPDTTKQEISIEYTDSDSVIVKTGYAGNYGDPLVYEMVNLAGNSSLLISKDTIPTYSPGSTTMNCANANIRLRQYPPEITCYPIPGGGNYCIGRYQFTIVRNKHTITLPLFDYFFSQTNGAFSSCTSSYFNMLDFVNKESLDKLQGGDSVLIRTGTMNLLK